MKLEIYFDYLCKFCEKGHKDWAALLPLCPWIEPVWRPCEAHPRVSEPGYGMHSDYAIRGMLFLQDHVGNATAYNDLVFGAVERRENIEDIDLLAACAGQAGCDPASFAEALRRGDYEEELQRANAQAWDVLQMDAVPTCVLEDGRRLDAVLGVGIPRDKLDQFLHAAR